jgi:decaprenyl-phosphate phosphoribosyltransferase
VREKVGISLPSDDLDRSSLPELHPGGRFEPFLRALRPRQWTKNLLVLAAPLAAGVLLTAHALPREGVAIVAFCLVASAGYLLNDVTDAAADRVHPDKRRRPVASGALSATAAVIGAAVLASTGLALATLLGAPFLIAVCGYVVVTVAYSLGLKRIAVVDLFLVASCYVLRAVAGGAAVHVPLSEWFLILTTSGALAVVSGKRAADLTGRGPDAVRCDYTESFLRSVWLLAGAVALVSYCLWAFDVPHKIDGIAWSQVSIIPFALAFLRYVYVMDRGHGGAPEEVMSQDRVIQVAVLVWAAIYAWGVYSR